MFLCVFVWLIRIVFGIGKQRKLCFYTYCAAYKTNTHTHTHNDNHSVDEVVGLIALQNDDLYNPGPDTLGNFHCLFDHFQVDAFVINQMELKWEWKRERWNRTNENGKKAGSKEGRKKIYE